MSELHEHYCLTDSAIASLPDSITDIDLLRTLPAFSATYEHPVTPIGLLYYIDSYGDFNDDSKEKHRYIARAIFESMDSSSKISVYLYLEWHNNGESDDYDDE